MRFSCTGIYEGSKETIYWQDGKIECENRLLRSLVENRARRLESDGIEIGPITGPPITGKDILGTALGALFLIRDHIFARESTQEVEVEELAGKIPEESPFSGPAEMEPEY